ncbi:hypothetical protein OUZ56_030781 [Daphnia magna]|uniref:Uncharacterized protein n=1 Tax=Daphnia magna TaxID=35525 RepID=A0ABQ9ZSA4_9CRUS|nr:hypothetical protein OUZ56_030781 [Daphnia magna]
MTTLTSVEKNMGRRALRFAKLSESSSAMPNYLHQLGEGSKYWSLLPVTMSLVYTMIVSQYSWTDKDCRAGQPQQRVMVDIIGIRHHLYTPNVEGRIRISIILWEVFDYVVRSSLWHVMVT